MCLGAGDVKNINFFTAIRGERGDCSKVKALIISNIDFVLWRYYDYTGIK